MRKLLVLIIFLVICFVIGDFILDSYNIDKGGRVNGSKSTQNNLVLVNKENPISNDYNAGDLAVPNVKFLKSSISEEKLMQKEAAKALENLFQGATIDNIVLYANSAYRSADTQRSIYRNKKKKKGVEYAKNYVAKPYESEHETGLAIDVTNKERNFHEDSREAKWIENNAHKYGFILRYPKGKEHITGYNYEPWHIRYVGTIVANKIYKKGITLEEYL